MPSSSSPAHFSAYSSILRKNQRKIEHGDRANESALESSFNQLFQDVKDLRENGYTLSVVKTQTTFRQERERRGRFSEYSLLLRRIMDVKSNSRPKLQLEIQSDSLRHAFARLAEKSTTIRLNHDPIVIPEPFMEVYHCRQGIQESIKLEENDRTKAELQLLVNFQQGYMADTIRTIDQFVSNHYIGFEWLWAIFPPGDLVVIENVSAAAVPIQWCAVLESFEYQTFDSGVQIWCITITHTGFDGLRLGKTKTTLKFPAFTNNMAISNLPAYPIRFCKNQLGLRQNSVLRGKSYEAFCLASSRSSKKPIGTPMLHKGPIWTEKERRSEDRRGCRIVDSPSGTASGRAIVDFEGFFADYPHFRESIDSGNTPLVEDDGSDDELSFWARAPRRTFTDTSISQLGAPGDAAPLSDDDLLTCPPLLPIYSFGYRAWCFAFIDDLAEIDWKPQIFEQLRIDEEMKEAIQGLVWGYSTHATLFDDFIEGKGRGLVFLLHGPPGCGKTMTAESISETLQKPLYPVSGGELGASVESVQAALETAFDRAARWDTILLLDEADAFLAKRDGADIERNSLIAVFLRLLEYQSGIVFLTTNRLHDFDPAFASRIHLQLPFSNLDSSKRELIWTSLAGMNGNCKLTPQQTRALGKLPLDGRRIKNILRMASLFAANRSRGTGKTNGNAEGSTQGHEDVKVTLSFGDIKKVLPLAVTSLEDMKSQREQSKKTEDLSAAYADLMKEFKEGDGS